MLVAQVDAQKARLVEEQNEFHSERRLLVERLNAALKVNNHIITLNFLTYALFFPHA